MMAPSFVKSMVAKDDYLGKSINRSRFERKRLSQAAMLNLPSVFPNLIFEIQFFRYLICVEIPVEKP